MKINPDKKTSLKFKIQLQGAKHEPVARLMLMPEGKDHAIVIPASINHGVVEVKIPKKCEHLNFEEGRARLEVIVGQDYFVPWEENVVIEESFKLEVTPLQEEIAEEETPAVVVPDVMVSVVEHEEEEVAPVEEDCGKKHKKEKVEEEEDETEKAAAEDFKKKKKEKEKPQIKEESKKEPVDPHRKLTGYL